MSRFLPHRCPRTIRSKTGRRSLVFSFRALMVALLFLTVLPARGGESVSARKNAFARAYDIASPSVVSIRGEKRFEVSEVKNDYYKGKAAEKSKQENVTGMGSGIIMDPRGYIVTNYHVVKGLQKIQITTSDGTVYRKVEFVNYNPETDLALLKVTPREPLTPITFGKSERVYVCEDVLAIGNPFGYANAAARGIVSGLNRPLTSSDTVTYERTIQTDTPINPGNSGGPLVNLDGEMIGMNAAVRDDAQNIAFAIPVDLVVKVTDEMIKSSVAKMTHHGLVLEEEFTPTEEYPNGETETDYVRIGAVQAKSPAEAAGLKPGDILIESNGIPIHNALDFTRSMIGVTLSDQINVKVRRNGAETSTVVAMGQFGKKTTPDEGPLSGSETLVASAKRPITGGDEIVSHPEEEFREATAAPSYAQNVPGKGAVTSMSKKETVKRDLGIEIHPVGKEEFKRLYPNLSVVSMDNYKIIPSGGVMITQVEETTLFQTAKSGVQKGDLIFGFVIDNSQENRWEITSLENLYFIARKWNEFAAEGSNAKIYLIRDGVPYFLDIPMSPIVEAE